MSISDFFLILGCGISYYGSFLLLCKVGTSLPDYYKVRKYLIKTKIVALAWATCMFLSVALG